ncbi:class A beta-lactamase [Legionella clemsonensis]|uniref:beta-lactamase n=1 Tax=Legionella clemsonensis TaxID=1867846 RepID=A0A222P2W1_9GAMM|nr:class A beta-lactamase [Legionella clemsonensis]ASQ46176.1 Beta-lactamase Toho-1 precursor [Legionella clemsonensis]
MNFFPRKRLFLLITLTIIFISTFIPAFANTEPTQLIPIEKKFEVLEASMNGRIGVFAINTANNQHIQYRADERFPIQSTFKVMAVSAILKQSMTDKHLLQQKMTYTKKDLVFWSPITEKHLASGMTISELCSAAIMYSDNTATNLIVKKLGGPNAVTAFARSIKDSTFRVDNWEPELNSNPNNLLDTSTPIAMEKSLQKLTLGNTLALPQREQLVTWMKNNTTGDARIRAGVPKRWIVADKTGSGNGYGISNDIGIIWPPSCAPIVVTIYSVHNEKATTPRDNVIASATRLIIKEFAQTDKCIKEQASNA